MTSTEIAIVLMDDILILINDLESEFIVEVKKQFPDEHKVEVLRVGAMMAFETMRGSIARLKNIALRAQAHNVTKADA